MMSLCALLSSVLVLNTKGTLHDSAARLQGLVGRSQTDDNGSSNCFKLLELLGVQLARADLPFCRDLTWGLIEVRSVLLYAITRRQQKAISRCVATG